MFFFILYYYLFRLILKLYRKIQASCKKRGWHWHTLLNLKIVSFVLIRYYQIIFKIFPEYLCCVCAHLVLCTLLFMNVNGVFVFRFLTLSIHLWHWEPHQPVQYQWNTSAPCSTHLHPAERASVCGGRNQHQWGENKDLLSLILTLFCNDTKTDF